MRIRQHIPNSFEGFEKAEAEVGSWLDIIKLPWVQRICCLPGFHRWSLERHYAPDTHLLMAEFSEGAQWWVIAYLEADEGGLDRLRILPDLKRG